MLLPSTSKLQGRSITALVIGAVGLLVALTLWKALSRSGPHPYPRHSDPGSPRIAALSPALAATIRDLGHGGLLVGRHGFDQWSDQSLPVCGDQAGIDYEALLRVRPTHVFIEWGQRELPDRLRELGATNQWKIEPFTLLTLQQIAQSAARADALGGAPDAPRSTLAKALRDFTARTPEPATKYARAGSVLMLISVQPAAALGPGCYHHEVLERIGGQGVLRAAPGLDAPYVELDAEDVARLAPDAIVLVMPRGPREQTRVDRDAAALRAELGPLASLDLPAIRVGRIGLIDDPEALLPSTSVLRFARDLEALLRLWAGDSAGHN